jgi:hypothetical protein
MRMKAVVLSALLIGFAFISGSASADSISVQNGSFEQTSSPLSLGGYNDGPIPNWTLSGTVAGSWAPVPGTYFHTVPDGSTVAFVDGTISQDLGVALLPNTTYTLSVFVGDRADGFNLNDPWSIMLGDGSASCTASGIGSNIPEGYFADETCSFTTGSSVPSGDLIVSLSGKGQADFDDVTVTAPEPTSLALEALGLLALALFGMFFKRKQGVTVE